MVLAAGLTSRREPASFGRHLVERGIDGAYDLVVTDTLLDELHGVLTSPKFIAQMSDEEAATAIEGLAAVAWKVVSDMYAAHERLTNDPATTFSRTPHCRLMHTWSRATTLPALRGVVQAHDRPTGDRCKAVHLDGGRRGVPAAMTR